MQCNWQLMWQSILWGILFATDNLWLLNIAMEHGPFVDDMMDPLFKMVMTEKRWNSARSWCSFALGGVWGGAWSVCKPNFRFTEQEGAVLAPSASFLPMLRASGMLGQRWHRIGLCWAILVVFCGFCWPLLGKSWDHIGLVLGHFGLCWDILGHVGQELGPYWACLGPFWAMLGHFGPCWSHIGLILGHFGLFSDLCRPLFWTRAFQRRWLFVHASACKKHQKYQEKIHQKY